MKLISILALALSATPLVLAHGKMTAPLGLNVDPNTPLNSQSDVAIGVSQRNPCGRSRAGGKPDQSDMTPRATYVAGSTTSFQWFMQNQDGGGPLQVMFSGDNGQTFQAATVTQQAPGRFSLTNQGNKEAQVEFEVPDMECASGQCLMMVRNPVTFGSCCPVEIVQNGENSVSMTYETEGGVTTEVEPASAAGAAGGGGGKAAGARSKLGRLLGGGRK
ncbi:hypothetical protein HK104_008720 [Borealophlyctis nickersoniae]|nr:hypothetical protein HK104_008720 [Borealophlyctis nickersoniae]